MPPSSHPTRRTTIPLATALGLGLAACQMEDFSVGGEANRAVGAAHAVLVAHGLCASVRDCSDRGVAAWDGYGGVARVRVRASLDSAAFRELADSCRRIVRTDPRRAPLELRADGRPDRWEFYHNFRQRFDPA